MTIPLYIFLFLYLVFVFVWLIFSLIALYHIIKWGEINFTSFFLTFVYLIGSAAILFFSYQYLSQIDWGTGLEIFQGGTNMFGVENF